MDGVFPEVKLERRRLYVAHCLSSKKVGCLPNDLYEI